MHRVTAPPTPRPVALVVDHGRRIDAHNTEGELIAYIAADDAVGLLWSGSRRDYPGNRPRFGDRRSCGPEGRAAARAWLDCVLIELGYDRTWVAL